MKRIFAIPNPRTNILLFTSLLFGVNALGTSKAGTTIVLTGKHKVSGQPTALNATRQALKVPVALYWCSILLLDVVDNVSPSPNIHLKLTAFAEDELIKTLGVFSTGAVGV